MNCRALLMRANDLLDARMDPRLDQIVIEHASVCPECARAIGELVALSFLACRASSHAQPASADLTRWVMAEIRATKPATISSGKVIVLPVRTLQWSGAVAACLAVFLVGLSVGKGVSPGSRQPVIGPSSMAAAPLPRAEEKAVAFPYIQTVPASRDVGWSGLGDFSPEEVWGPRTSGVSGWVGQPGPSSFGVDQDNPGPQADSEQAQPSDSGSRQPIVPRGQSRIRNSGGSGVAHVSNGPGPGGSGVPPPTGHGSSSRGPRPAPPSGSDGSRRIIVIIPGQEF